MSEKPSDNPDDLKVPEVGVFASLESTLEEELSAEVIEVIMQKVQDINKNETGVSVVLDFSEEKLKKILENGLLGTTRGTDVPKEEGGVSKEAWIENVKKGQDVFVYFDIVGRNADDIESAHYIYRNMNPMAVVFDVNKFKEDENDYLDPVYVDAEVERYDYVRGLKKHKNRTFGAHSYDKEGENRLYGFDTGFALNSRIAPRFFSGIVFRLDDKHIENSPSISKNRYESMDAKDNKKKAEEIARIMKSAYIERVNLMLPVYGVRGNLLWPKQMSYEEVKKFVEERDKDKKEE